MFIHYLLVVAALLTVDLVLTVVGVALFHEAGLLVLCVLLYEVGFKHITIALAMFLPYLIVFVFCCVCG